MKKIVILTGSETRHTFFRMKLSLDSRFQVIASFCEGDEKSLANRTLANKNSTQLEKLHVEARGQAETDFFSDFIDCVPDNSQPIFLKKGAINEWKIVDTILKMNPCLIICYGSSIIKSELLDAYKYRFLNVHLGLSPYYRGSGTNIWPLINGEPHMLGATFMHIDAGIDTGRIVHQIGARFFIGDSCHSIGMRLIKDMTITYADIIGNFDHLTIEDQPVSTGHLYQQKDFDGASCRKLYEMMRSVEFEHHVSQKIDTRMEHLVRNAGLENVL